MEARLVELLLGCLHWEAGGVSADDLAALTDSDWEAFLVLAAEQRIRPLLYQRLTDRGLDAVVPERVMGALRAVYLALRLAVDLVGAAVPAAVLAALQPADLSAAILATARQQIFTEKKFSSETTSRAISLRQQPGFFPKLAYAWRKLLPPPASLRLLYARRVRPNWLPLYYAAHIGEFVQRYSRTIWNSVTGERSTHELLERKQVVHKWLSGE